MEVKAKKEVTNITVELTTEEARALVSGIETLLSSSGCKWPMNTDLRNKLVEALDE